MLQLFHNCYCKVLLAKVVHYCIFSILGPKNDPYPLLQTFFVKVLSNYPEAMMTTDQQNSSLGEAYTQLAKRLDDGISVVIYLLYF